MNLEKAMKEAKEKHKIALAIELSSKEVALMKTHEQDVAEFKESKEYKHATQEYEVGYNKGVEAIFFNIWCKHRHFKFLGKV